jgi:hypothetical protein
MRARPVSISVIGVFLLAATVIAGLVGTSLLFPGTFLDRIWELNKPAYKGFQAVGKISGLLLLLVGLCTGYAGAGLFKGQNRARRLAIALFAVNGLGDVVNFLRPAERLKSAAGALIAATFIFYLLRPNVIAFFERPRHS